MRQYARSRISSASAASFGFRRPFERDGEMRSDGLLHAIVQVGLAPPALERGARVAVVGRHRDQRLVGADRRARARPCGTESGRAGRAPASASGSSASARSNSSARVGVAPFERRGHAGAEMEPRVLRIGGERLAKAFGGGVRLAGVERRPGRALDQRAARIDLRREAPRTAGTAPSAATGGLSCGPDHHDIVCS